MRVALLNNFNLFLLVSDWLELALVCQTSSIETKGRTLGYSILEGYTRIA
jgi:hypothetical protein